MTTAPARPTFLSALRASGAAAPFVASLIGRLPMGAVGLVFILRTKEITGSFAAGGIATAAYALSIGVLAPGMGRLIDLKGQTRVLLGTGVVYASALAAFAALPGDAGLGVIVALAALTGASQPPLGATVRALWNQTLDDPTTRHVLFTGESAVLEAIYISGPVLIVADRRARVDPSGGPRVRDLRAARDRDVRHHGRLARVAAGARPHRRARRRARLPGRADAARHVDGGRRRRRRDRGRGPALCERAGSPSATGFVLGFWGSGA